MKWNRVIVHSDINHCYAQIEEMKYPELRKVPMAVGGNEKSRHGIILAKNDLAKKYDIKTGESLRDAHKKCPELLIIPPNYEEYMYYTEQVKDIYREYTDKVESFGLDEAWFDLTSSQALFGDPVILANKIQKRVLNELGLTVSMGISYNKIFAKLGSDMFKPYGLVAITPKNYEDIVYPLQVEDLLYVGRATKRKLNARNIFTIGELAKSNKKFLKSFLGINGEMLWYFANGFDATEVNKVGYSRDVKSIGNSITTIRDMKTFEDIKMVFYVLAESIASRLKEHGLKGSVISIYMRNTDLYGFSRQRKITEPTNLTNEIMDTVLQLVRENCSSDQYGNLETFYRSIGVSISKLVGDNKEVQLNLFIDEEERQKEKNLELTIDKIRSRYGFKMVKRCILEKDINLTNFNPKDDNVIHPESWF